jgi:hypothetical protein
MSWLIGLAGLGVQAGVGYAGISAQKSAAAKAAKLQKAQQDQSYKLAMTGLIVVGAFLSVYVVVQLVKTSRAPAVV